MLLFHKTTEDEKQRISDWRYDGAYAVYNLPPYAEQLRMHRGFANPKNNFYSFADGSKLIGYINLIEEETAVFFGIGLNPLYCNQGYGQRICKKALRLSHQLYPQKPVYLEVRTWNCRAVRCYEKAGFRIVGEPIIRTTPIGEGTFFHMEENGARTGGDAEDASQ